MLRKCSCQVALDLDIQRPYAKPTAVGCDTAKPQLHSGVKYMENCAFKIATFSDLIAIIQLVYTACIGIVGIPEQEMVGGFWA